MMAKERTPTSYLDDDWSGTPPGGTSASGAGETPDYDKSVPYRSPMPETKEWQIAGFGHSADCKDTGTKSSAWGMSKDDQARGYENLKSDGEGSALQGPRQPYGSFEQSLPKTNDYTTHDRSREFRGLEEGEHPGTGNDNPHPGSEQIGSRLLP